MKPICVPCQRFYRPKQNGFAFIEGMPFGSDVQPGTTEADKWHPYKLWIGDLWECRGCGHQLVSGTGAYPVAEHYQPGFKPLVEKHRATLQINDC